jgi:hypothetical protein
MRLVRVATASQLADIFTKGLHYPQREACVEGILGRTLALTSQGTSVLRVKRGGVVTALKSSHVGPKEGVSM